MSPQTMEQERAEYALNMIGQVNNSEKEYGSLARGLPAMLQVNGLGNTLAFLHAKAKGNPPARSYHARLYAHLTGWLHRKVRRQLEPNTHEGPEMFVNWLMGKDSTVYRMAAVEAMAYAIWLRRLAEAKGWSEENIGGE